MAFRHIGKLYFLRSLAVYGYGGGFAVVAVYFGAALLLYGVFAGGHFNIKPELITLVQLVLGAVHGNGNLVAFGYIHALNGFLDGQFRLRFLLFGVGIGHGNGFLAALGKRYAVIRVKIAVFGLYEVVTIYVGISSLGHGVSTRVELYSLAELALFQGYGLIAYGHGNFVIIGQFNAILKPFNLLYHGQLGLFGNTLVFVDDGDIGLAVVRYRHAEYFVYAVSIVGTVFLRIHACKLIAVYICEGNFLYVVTVFFKLKRMGEAVRLVQLEGQVNRLIRVIHIHGNFVIIGNVNAFNDFLYGKLTGIDYRAMLDIFICDNNSPAVVVLIKCYLEAIGYIPLPNRRLYEIVIWNTGSIGFAYSIFLANLNLELYLHKVRYAHGLFFVADLHLYSVILRKLSYAVAIYGLTYFNLYLPRFGSGGRRGVDFPLGYKLCVGIHVKALSFAYGCRSLCILHNRSLPSRRTLLSIRRQQPTSHW